MMKTGQVAFLGGASVVALGVAAYNLLKGPDVSRHVHIHVPQGGRVHVQITEDGLREQVGIHVNELNYEDGHLGHEKPKEEEWATTKMFVSYYFPIPF